jgi:hypothetical protein
MWVCHCRRLLRDFELNFNKEFQFSHRYNPKMEPSYTQDLRNCPERHPETPIDAILILVRLFTRACLDTGRLDCKR